MTAPLSPGTLRTILVSFLGLCLLCPGPLPGQQKAAKRKKSPAKTSRAVSYKHDVFPVIRAYCLPCHTEDQMNPSELYLDTYDNLMKGGKHGRPVIPEKSDSSMLVLKLSPKPPFGDPMPLKRKTPVSQDTVNIFKKWIDQGGKDN
jgi:hypothetical protein